MLELLRDLAALKILNRNFVECRDNYFEEKYETRKLQPNLAEDRDTAADVYFGAVRGLAHKYHVNEIDLAWQLCFQVTHQELVTA